MSNLAPGSVFAGEYRIVQPLSAGGMGAVYIAEQMGTGKRRALKLMLPELVRDDRLRQRFEQEARVGSRIDSEHVVEVVDAGVDRQTGMPWLAMELLEGEDLSHWRPRQAQLPVQDARRILEEMCHAVGAAHRAGIVHRDLKPENLFVAKAKRVGSNFTLKVLDFGIAKLVEEARGSRTAAVGTPLWMAPEQTEAQSSVAPSSDVWAIGLIAFWLFTGRTYWKGGNVAEPSIATLLREVVLDPLVPASQRAAELGVAALLPHGFDGWFARAVERQPQLRYQNAQQAFAAIDAILATSSAMPTSHGGVPSGGPIPSSGGMMPTPQHTPQHMMGSNPAGISGGYAYPSAAHATPAMPPMPVTPLPGTPGYNSYGAHQSNPNVKPMGSGAGTGCLIAVIVVVVLSLLGVGGCLAFGVWSMQSDETNCANGSLADSDRLTACENVCDREGEEYASACMNLGDLRTKSGDIVGAKQAYASACEKGNATGCAQK